MALELGSSAMVSSCRSASVAAWAEAGAAAGGRHEALAGGAALGADRGGAEVLLALEVISAGAPVAAVVDELNAAWLTIVEPVSAGAAGIAITGEAVLVADALSGGAGPLAHHADAVDTGLVGGAADVTAWLVGELTLAEAVEAELV